MKINEHNVDRVLRVIIGVFVFTLIFWGPKSLWGAVGLIPIITGLTGNCPLYSLFGFSTCKVEKQE